MSLYGVLRTGVSGMNAQSNKLGTVAENIQNSSTTGYKRASTEFSSLILSSGKGSYTSGSVTTAVRYSIGHQGPISYTTSGSDLAISGNGFFVVSDPSGTPYLTRAGNFVVDGATGNLVNAAGFTLLGQNIFDGDPGLVLNGVSNLVPVNIASLGRKATPSTEGAFTGNLPFNADIVPPADRPPTGNVYSEKSSLIVYDNVGRPVKLDIYLTKTAGNEWQLAVYDGSDPANFPSTPLAAATTLTFDGMGQLTGPNSLSVNIPNGQGFTLDLTGMTQLAGDYDVEGAANGNTPSAVEGAEFSADGTVYVVYEDGTRIPAYRVPLANVPSPDNLTPRAGNVYEVSQASGGLVVKYPGEGGVGTIAVGALEQSNVDIGTELTAMIEAQTGYTANSKVFQTGTELLDVLMSLKR